MVTKRGNKLIMIFAFGHNGCLILVYKFSYQSSIVFLPNDSIEISIFEQYRPIQTSVLSRSEILKEGVEHIDMLIHHECT